jgi:hypothetical protein
MSKSSIAAAEQLFEAFPKWRSLARNETAEDGSSYFVVEVAPPESANVEHGLVIDTSNKEITVGFDCYHSHFDEWVGDGEHFGTEAAIEFINQILEERVSVISWWFNERWRGSAQLEAGAKPEAPSWSGSETFNRIRVRSWRGSHNADISV